MVWNEPGKDDKKDKNDYKDPWGRKSKDAPPNLDEVFKKVQDQLNQIFSGKKRRSTPPGGGKKGGGLVLPGSGLLLIIFLVLTGLMGFFIVGPAEEAAVLRFGKWKETVGPGLHWIIPVVESKEIVNVTQINSTEHQALMLTQDENIVSVAVGVQYRVGNLYNYLFEVNNPKLTLEQATDSAVRQVIGHSTLDQILTKGRGKIRDEIKKELSEILTSYKAGLVVEDVPMQPAKAPDEVKEAFDDVIKSREDKQRSIQLATAYEKQYVPIAEGKAKRLIAQAQAYKQDVIFQAQGNTALFKEVLPVYLKAPVVTRERMYLNTMEKVLSNTSKVLVDSTDNNSLMYLPLDRMLAKSGAKSNNSSGSSSVLSNNQLTTAMLPKTASYSNQTRRAGSYNRGSRIDYSR